jgi:hypothetical protein
MGTFRMLSLVIVLAGCTHTYSIGPAAQYPDIPPENVHPRLQGFDVTIHLLNGETYAARDVIVGDDSTYFADARTKAPRVLANKDVHKLTIVRHGQGFFHGLLFGLSTAAVSVGYGALSWSSETWTSAAVIAGVAVVGFPLVGGIIGSKEEFVLNKK